MASRRDGSTPYLGSMVELAMDVRVADEFVQRHEHKSLLSVVRWHAIGSQDCTG